jgi:hypothetical protein
MIPILSSGVHTFGNNKIVLQKWPKVRIGEKRFEEIVNTNKKTSDRKRLIEEIIDLLSDKTV